MTVVETGAAAEAYESVLGLGVEAAEAGGDTEAGAMGLGAGVWVVLEGGGGVGDLGRSTVGGDADVSSSTGLFLEVFF